MRRESVAVLVPKPDAEQFLASARQRRLRPTLPGTKWVAGAIAASFAVLATVLVWTQSDYFETTPSVYLTATDAGSGASFDYVLLLSFAQGIDTDLRNATLQALAPVSIAGPDSGGNFRVVIRLPARSLEELEDYRHTVESDSAISRAAIVAIELPVETR